MTVEADTVAVATSAPKGYSADETAQAAKVAVWLEERKLSRSWLARKAKISSSTISQVLSGKYPASPAAYLRQMLDVLEVETERTADGTPGYVEGSVHKLVQVVCDRTRKHATFGVVCGHVGVGKTASVKEYARRKSQTLVVEANPMMTAGSLLDELLAQLGGSTTGMDRKFQAVVKALAGTNYLIVVDEAEIMSPQALHYLRRLRDKAQIGVALVGTERLHQLLKPEIGQFDQIRSRVSMWPATVQAITRDDADDMARAALVGHEPDDAVLDALWAFCAGSARVLNESLIPALRDYGLGRQPLTAKLVEAVATQVLFLKRKGG